MGRALCLSLGLLFLANVIPSKAQKAEAGARADGLAESRAEGRAEETRVTVAAGAPLSLECRLRPEQRAEWRRDGGALPADLQVEAERPAPDGRLAARLRAAAARPRHAGLYTCSRERDQRVRLLVEPAAPQPPQPPQPPQLPAGEAATAAAATGGAAAGGATEMLFDVKGNFTLNCTLPSDSKLQYIWKKNETLVDEIWDLKGRFILENNGSQFHVPRALEDDFGNYSCAAAGGAAEQRWAVRGRPIMRLPVNTNVVEGQKLKLVCKVTGKPYPEVTWQYTNSSEENAVFVDVGAVLGPRAELAASEQGVEGAALVLAAAQRADAGRYRCTAAQGTPGETVLRVKDMYAALWPFLGICAEVFVLCAIILVYEKRRTKPELDDSDTDNHDQKKS